MFEKYRYPDNNMVCNLYKYHKKKINNNYNDDNYHNNNDNNIEL
jgi:hypothetical protein